VKHDPGTSFHYATPYDIEQSRIEYARGSEYYGKRITALNFRNMGRVLDAGCGYGQWSLVLSENNRWITAVDINAGALEIAREAARQKRRENIAFIRGDLHDLDFPSSVFEGIFCYGVWMFTREDRVLSEFSRVLKPGGVLYICSDGPAWPLYRFIKWGIGKPDIRIAYSSCRIVWDTFFYGKIRKEFTQKRTFLSEKRVKKLLKANHIETVHFGSDGSFGNPGGSMFHPPYGKKLLGMYRDFEVLGRKHA
jgi:ubiquinone/menaquinone biosynthesis C-methylase UbiE